MFFDSYYGGKAADRKQYEILDKEINDILIDQDEFLTNILEGIKSYPNDKSKLSQRIEKFLDDLKTKHDFQYKETIFENFKIKDENERLLMMLKYLHSGEKTRSDIAEDFGISERTIANYLAKLQEGFTFLGTQMEIQGLERGTNKYRSLIHPIFLPLNAAETYALTVGLKHLSKDTVFQESLGRIADVVYEQLSDSSQEMIDRHKDDTVHFGSEEMKFINSMKLMQMQDSPFSYYLKEPIECIVSYNEKDEYVNYQGILKLVEPSCGNTYDQVKLENEEGTWILDMENIMSIRRVDGEEYFK